jgi:hypothetical protein
MKTRIQKLLVGAALAGAATLAQAQFNYTNNGNGSCTITGYTGPGGTVTIPDSINGLSVVGIGKWAFLNNSSVTSVTIPAGVTSIAAFAFYCYTLTAITVDAASSFYSSANGVLFDKNQTTLIEFPGGRGGSYTIPDSVTSIGDYAFAECYFLTNATIGKGVTSIGDHAFLDCTRLTSVTIPNSVTSIGDLAFYDCNTLTSVTMGDAVTNIGNYAFYDCTSLTAAYFLGNAPSDGGDVFVGDPVIVYYLPGATGWGPFFSGVATELWNPQASALRVTGGHFGFNITGPSNTVMVVEACTNLANATWVPLQSLNLTNGAFYFSDPNWTNYPARFYRIRSP